MTNDGHHAYGGCLSQNALDRRTALCSYGGWDCLV